MTRDLDTIEQLEAQVEQLEDALRQARSRLGQARIDAAEFAVDDVVLARRRTGGYAPAIVREVLPVSWGPWYVVSFARKDGSWSKSPYRAFSNVRANA